MTDLERLAHWINSKTPLRIDDIIDGAMQELGLEQHAIVGNVYSLLSSGAVECCLPIFEGFFGGSDLYFGSKSKFAHFLAFLASRHGHMKTIGQLKRKDLWHPKTVNDYLYIAYNLGLVNYKEEDGDKKWYALNRKYLYSCVPFPYLYKR